MNAATARDLALQEKEALEKTLQVFPAPIFHFRVDVYGLCFMVLGWFRVEGYSLRPFFSLRASDVLLKLARNVFEALEVRATLWSLNFAQLTEDCGRSETVVTWCTVQRDVYRLLAHSRYKPARLEQRKGVDGAPRKTPCLRGEPPAGVPDGGTHRLHNLYTHQLHKLV